MTHFKAGQKVRFLGTGIKPILRRGGHPEGYFTHDTLRGALVIGREYTITAVSKYRAQPDTLWLDGDGDIHEDCWFELVVEPEVVTEVEPFGEGYDWTLFINFCNTGEMA